MGFRDPEQSRGHQRCKGRKRGGLGAVVFIFFLKGAPKPWTNLCSGWGTLGSSNQKPRQPDNCGRLQVATCSLRALPSRGEAKFSMLWNQSGLRDCPEGLKNVRVSPGWFSGSRLKPPISSYFSESPDVPCIDSELGGCAKKRGQGKGGEEGLEACRAEMPGQST